MPHVAPFDPLGRVFTQLDADRTDELGFLDLDRIPNPVRFDTILEEPLAWVLGPPWLGKSTVAQAAIFGLRAGTLGSPDSVPRCTLSRLGLPGIERELPPVWWERWCESEPPLPAVWFLDGVDEGLDRNAYAFESVLHCVARASAEHLRTLRLILFSRPRAELGDFRERLGGLYAGIGRRIEPPTYWLARLDRCAAEHLVGTERFPSVLDVIRSNGLQTVAGYPVVLKFLADYRETAALAVPQVWRGVLTALLGERSSNPSARFDTAPEDRFAAACRIASILTLTRRERIRDYSPDPDEVTVSTLFRHPENKLIAAARDACRTPVFVQLPEQGTYRFVQRNVQDWLTAFGLQPLPLPSLRSALSRADRTLCPRLAETARLIRSISDRDDVRAEVDRLSGGVTLPSDALEPTFAEACRCLDRLERLAEQSLWGLHLDGEGRGELSRLRVDGFGSELARRLRDQTRPARVKQLLIDIAEETHCLEAVDSAVELVLDRAEAAQLRVDALWLVVRYGGDAHLSQLERPIGEASETDEASAAPGATDPVVSHPRPLARVAGGPARPAGGRGPC